MESVTTLFEGRRKPRSKADISYVVLIILLLGLSACSDATDTTNEQTNSSDETASQQTEIPEAPGGKGDLLNSASTLHEFYELNEKTRRYLRATPLLVPDVRLKQNSDGSVRLKTRTYSYGSHDSYNNRQLPTKVCKSHRSSVETLMSSRATYGFAKQPSVDRRSTNYVSTGTLMRDNMIVASDELACDETAAVFGFWYDSGQDSKKAPRRIEQKNVFHCKNKYSSGVPGPLAVYVLEKSVRGPEPIGDESSDVATGSNLHLLSYQGGLPLKTTLNTLEETSPEMYEAEDGFLDTDFYALGAAGTGAPIVRENGLVGLFVPGDGAMKMAEWYNRAADAKFPRCWYLEIKRDGRILKTSSLQDVLENIKQLENSDG